MTNDAAVAWRIRIGDSHTWGFTSDEDDADFHGKNSGLPYVKEALVPTTTVAELRAEVEAEAVAFRNAFMALHKQSSLRNGTPCMQAEVLCDLAVRGVEAGIRAHLTKESP